MPYLTKTEIQKVRNACDALLHKTVDTPSYEQELYDIVQDVVKSATGCTMLPFSRFVKLQHYEKFKNDSSTMNEFVVSQFKPTNNAFRRKAFVLMLNLILQRMQALEITITPSKLMELLHIGTDAVSHAFPGYAKAGLLPVILTQSSK